MTRRRRSIGGGRGGLFFGCRWVVVVVVGGVHIRLRVEGQEHTEEWVAVYYYYYRGCLLLWRSFCAMSRCRMGGIAGSRSYRKPVAYGLPCR